MSGHPRRPASRDEFEIAIICALQVERDAVDSVIDEEYETDGFSYGVAKGDNNAYTTGRIGNNSIVLAYMPGMGKVSSAVVAAQLRISFQQIKVCLIVGICGGAPRTPEGADILLGDIIISTAIVQVDFGRQYPNRFMMKQGSEGNINQATPQIRAFIGRAMGRRIRQRLEEKSAEFGKRIAQREAILYPGIEHDNLYPAQYRHKHHFQHICQICDQCQTGTDETCGDALVSVCPVLGCEIQRTLPRDRIPTPWESKIHFGRIASGDGVMKSGQHRDNIVSSEKVIAFEMEGAGAWESLPTIVIKSVCDYADSHKNKKWQIYAATMAASGMKALLVEWRTADRSLLPAEPSKAVKRSISTLICDDSIQTSSPISHSLDNPEAIGSIKQRCLKALCFLDIDSRQHDIALAHHQTCDWLFDTNEFKKWEDYRDLEHTNGVFWIRGKPGAGKSTLMKHAFIHCQTIFPEAAIAAYFFHARGTFLQKSPSGLLRSLVFQLLNHFPLLLEHISNLLVHNEKIYGESQWEWHSSQLKESLIKSMQNKQQKPIILFVDALDECEESDVRDIVAFLEDLSRLQMTSLRICLSSRHYPTISMKKFSQLTVEHSPSHSGDMKIYIQHKLKVQNEEIERELLRKAAGIFMWVVLVTQILNQKYEEGNIFALKQALHDIPSDIDEVFQAILEKDNDQLEQTVLMLQWVLFAKEELSMSMLHSAVLAESINREQKHFSIMGIDISNGAFMERFITTTSRGLIEIVIKRKRSFRPGTDFTLRVLSRNDRAQFIHETVNDFLIRNKRLQRLDQKLVPNVLGASHNRLACCCFSYVRWIDDTQKHLHPGLGKTNRKKFKERFPFLKYASTQALRHAEDTCNRNFESFTHFQEFLKNRTFQRQYQKWHDFYTSDVTKQYGTDTSLLYWFAIDGHAGLVRQTLSESTTGINTQGGHLGYPLHAASFCGNHVIMQLLLKAGADKNAVSGFYGTAVQASICGYILSTRCNREQYYTKLYTPLRLLLKVGADVNVWGGYYGTPLHASVCIPDIGIAGLLLAAGADVNASAGRYGTPLLTVIHLCQRKEYSSFHIEFDAIKALLIEYGAHQGSALES